MLSAHRGFAYLILLTSAIFILALLMVMFGYSGRISKLLKKSTLFTMIFFHTQALVGLVMLFFFSPGFKAAIKAGELMTNEYRPKFIEHPTAMIIAAVLLTIFNKKLKTRDTISMPMVIIAAIAMALMLWAFQWHRLFGA